MLCLACAAPTRSSICRTCGAQLRPAPETMVEGDLLVVAAYVHEGPARRLVHALKYRGVEAAAVPFARRLAPHLPDGAAALVPVPRAVGRAIRYGVDPAQVLATAVSRLTGIPVARALRAPLWWPRHAGSVRGERAAIHFRQRSPIPRGTVLVDDVVTTGATVLSAAGALTKRPTLVLAATVAPRITSGESPSGARVIGAPASGTNDRISLRAPPFDSRRRGAFGSGRSKKETA